MSIARVSVKGFTKRNGLKRLVYMEFYETIIADIQREPNMKHWPRAWRAQLNVFLGDEECPVGLRYLS
jgi:predicted GIY-YIG superfamily endonuclease